MIMNLHTCWLTLNRSCNLRCKWCYAQDSKFDKKYNMNLPVAKSLIDICIGNSVRNFILIGGEPTLHNNFFEIIEYIIDKDCEVTVVTNGIKLSSKSICDRLKLFDKDKFSFSISLKGATNFDYHNNCGNAIFSKVLKCIENCKKNDWKYSLSYVISSESIDNIEIFARQVRESGIVDTIGFSYCCDILTREGDFFPNNAIHLIEIDKTLSKKYEILSDILQNKFSLHQVLPLCMCDKKMFDEMTTQKQVYTSCHTHNRTGVIFDTDASILLCNHFVGYGIGKYNKDYWDTETFKEYWNSENMTNLHNKLISMPSTKCATCEIASQCGGGCCIQWFSHTFESYNSKYMTINNINN